nr:MMPL family transporter [Auraticoccus cholistanensis]
MVGTTRRAWLVLVVAVLAVGAAFAWTPRVDDAALPGAGLPAETQSAQVDALLEEFPGADDSAALLVWDRGGEPLDDADRRAVGERAAALAEESTTPEAVRPQVSEDGTAALVVVPVAGADVDADLAGLADRFRALAAEDLPAGLTSRLTGPVGFSDDVSGAFAGADLRLLLVTVAVVAVLLIITYRSPLLWLVPLLVVGTADGLARVVVAPVAEAAGLPVDASISGILSVLVFGAGTNYALLLVARYREELQREPDRHVAMATAVRSAGPAVLASGGTVVLSLLTLLLASLEGNRALGLACALGVVLAMASALLVLPAALVVCGRGLFWPLVPRVRDDGEDVRPGLWHRLGEGVARRPALVAVVAVCGVAVLALGLGSYRVGLSQTEQLLGEPESVQAQAVLDRSFSAGLSGGIDVLVPADRVEPAVALVEGLDRVGSVRPLGEHEGLARLSVTSSEPPQSEGAFQLVRDLRSGLAAEPGLEGALVGGSDATALDTLVAAEEDLELVVPLILGVVALVLLVLLRSLLAPVLLIASVLGTFFASLGAGAWLFEHVWGFPALDANVTLYAFLFLIALGVDYNIFLTSRAREERAVLGYRAGMVAALGSTGGVITSAGILLAAVFAVLGVLPVVALTQIGVVVCLGVLLDTLVVRTLLVPALAFLTREAFWWPR